MLKDALCLTSCRSFVRIFHFVVVPGEDCAILVCVRVCSGFEELTCHCGAEVIYPPVPCGTKPPPCHRTCTRQHNCDHPGNSPLLSTPEHAYYPGHTVLESAYNSWVWKGSSSFFQALEVLENPSKLGLQLEKPWKVGFSALCFWFRPRKEEKGS